MPFIIVVVYPVTFQEVDLCGEIWDSDETDSCGEMLKKANIRGSNVLLMVSSGFTNIN